MVLFLTGRRYTTSEPLEGLCSPAASAVCPPQPLSQGMSRQGHLPHSLRPHVIIMSLEWREEFQIHYLSATEFCRFSPYTEWMTHTCTTYTPIHTPMLPLHFPPCFERTWCLFAANHSPRLKMLFSAFESYSRQTHALFKFCTSKGTFHRETTRALIQTHHAQRKQHTGTRRDCKH